MLGEGAQCPRPLGVGLTYFPVLESFLTRRADLIDVVEVSPETLWLDDGRGGYVCDQVQLDRLTGFPAPKVIHGVGNPVGGSAPADQVRLELLSAIVESFGSDLASEHLSFARVASGDGYDFTGFMLPPRQTAEGVEVAARAARAMAARVNVAFAIENGVSYLRRRRDEMSDGEFVAAVAEQADVGILLDLHNAYANERNGRGSMASFVAALPLERVVEIHLAGGLPHGPYWLDAHCGAMPDTVFGFARELVGSLPNLRVINFELMPLFFAEFGADGVTRELDRCHELWGARKSVATPRSRQRRAVVAVAAAPPDPAAWERQLATLARNSPLDGELGEDGEQSGDGELSGDPGIDVLRFLVAEFRAGLLARGLKLATRLLLLHLGEVAVRGIYADFFATRPPELFAAAEAEAFGDYLSGLDLEVPHLHAVVSFELALQRAAARGDSATIEFDGDPEAILSSLAAGIRPPPPTPTSQAVLVEAASD
ncbi:MAG TPA: DUF692 family protein [Streptosporangiaceae bacterium]|nr:DUF692 family protein [Streptosporangiaceae bacterium]